MKKFRFRSDYSVECLTWDGGSEECLREWTEALGENRIRRDSRGRVVSVVDPDTSEHHGPRVGDTLIELNGQILFLPAELAVRILVPVEKSGGSVLEVMAERESRRRPSTREYLKMLDEEEGEPS